MRTLLVSACVILTGCGPIYPQPYSVSAQRMAADLGHHFREVFPEREDPDLNRDAGLLSPRFGLPAIVRRGDALTIQVLERGGPVPIRAALVTPNFPAANVATCLSAPDVATTDCFPLHLDEVRRIATEGGLAIREVRAVPAEAPPAQAYDLVVLSEVDPPQRTRRSVFLTNDDPEAPRAIRIVQLSDLHVGKSGHVADIAKNLDAAIQEVNVLAPDLVVVTGDMAENGGTTGLEEWAAERLMRLDAPVLAIPGNHDYGYIPKVLHPDDPPAGWFQFARAFHPFRFTQLTYAGWELVGFDSGPLVLSPQVLTRGILPETVDLLGETIDRARVAKRRGVILFDHAPTRGVLNSDADDSSDDGFGKMAYGGDELEKVLLGASLRGQRVILLSGHTHWSDVFEAALGELERWPPAKLTCPRDLRASVAMINAPSATEITFPTIDHGKHFGFVELMLDEHTSRVVFHLHYRSGKSVPCDNAPGVDSGGPDTPK